MRDYLDQDLGFWGSFLTISATKLLGVGLGFIVMRFLIYSTKMPFPTSIYQAEVYRMLHERLNQDPAAKKETLNHSDSSSTSVLGNWFDQLTALQMFVFVFAAVFFYQWIPNFLWPGLSSLAFVCWVGGGSRVAALFGSGLKGFGWLSLDLNISDITNMYSTVFYVPAWLSYNVVFGGILWAWVIGPIIYYTNWLHTKDITDASGSFQGHILYTASGDAYPVDTLFNMDANNKPIWNQTAYDTAGPAYWNGWMATGYFFGFMQVAGTASYALCWHYGELAEAYGAVFGSSKSSEGEDQKQRTKELELTLERVSKSVEFEVAANNEISISHASGQTPIKTPSTISPAALFIEAHFGAPPGVAFGLGFTALFLCLLIGSCKGFDVDMPWWAAVVCVLIALVCVIPICSIYAVTGVEVGINVLCEIIGGLMLSHNPNGAMMVKTSAYMALHHCSLMMGNCKLGQYCAIDYYSVFYLQTWGILVSALADTIAFRIAYPLTQSGNPDWNGSGQIAIWVAASYQWGGIGPWVAVMGPESPYCAMFWSGIILGGILPWLLYKLHKTSFMGRSLDFLKYVHLPMAFQLCAYATENSLYITIFAMTYFFQTWSPRNWPRFYKEKTFVVAAGIIGGAGFCAFVVAMLQGFAGINLNLPDWMDTDAGCASVL